MILCQATLYGAWPFTAASPGLGTRMAALFAGPGLEEPIETWQGHEAEPADFST